MFGIARSNCVLVWMSFTRRMFFFTREMGYLNLCDDDGDRIFHNFALTHDASYLLLIVAGYRGIIRLIKCLMAYKALCWPQKCYQWAEISVRRNNLFMPVTRDHDKWLWIFQWQYSELWMGREMKFCILFWSQSTPASLEIAM